MKYIVAKSYLCSKINSHSGIQIQVKVFQSDLWQQCQSRRRSLVIQSSEVLPTDMLVSNL